MKLKSLCVFILSYFLCQNVLSQNKFERLLNSIDSLEKVVTNSKKNENAQIHLSIAEKYYQLTDSSAFDNSQTYERIIAEANKAYTFAESKGELYYQGKAIFQIANIYGYLGEIYGSLDSIKLSIATIDRAIRIVVETDSVDFLSELYNRKSSAYSNIEEYKRAIEICDTILTLDSEKLRYKNIKDCLYTKGISQFYLNDFTGAIKTFEELKRLATEKDDKGGINLSLNAIGNIEYRKGNLSEALKYFLESLKILEDQNEEFAAAIRRVNIGNVYKELTQYEEALKYYTEALSYFQKQEDYDSKSFTANCLNNIGIIYERQEKWDDAEGYYEEAIKVFQEVKDSTGLMTTYINIGNVYAYRNQFERALRSFHRALRIAQVMEDERRIALIYTNIGDAYYQNNQYSEAINNYNASQEIAKKIEVSDLLKNNYKGLSECYEALGNSQKALEYYKQFSLIKDEIFKEGMDKALAEEKVKRETAQKEAEIKDLNSQNALKDVQAKRDQIVKIGMGFIITLILVFTVVVFRQLQEKKKKNILLAEQKEEIETQRDEIMAQKDLLAKQKQEITDSIYYARRIQRAVLPPEQASSDILPEHFILFKPRDIVSGDFYWMTKRDNKTVLVDADCTGHGVPGAFMSMLGVAFLNEIVSSCEHLQADLILNELREYVKTTLGQKGKQDEAKDGMDIALCIIDWDTNKIQYAGAYNPLYYFKKGVFNEIKADKMPIGVYVKDQTPFTNNIIEFEKGDTFYIFSDGYVSQFGGTDGRKFMTKPFKALLETIQNKSMAEQMKVLDEALLEWQGNFEQVDDISVIGFRF